MFAESKQMSLKRRRKTSAKKPAALVSRPISLPANLLSRLRKLERSQDIRYNFIATSTSTAAGAFIELLEFVHPPIAKGDEVYEREGDNITLQSLMVRVSLTGNATAGADGIESFRLITVFDRSPVWTGASPGVITIVQLGDLLLFGNTQPEVSSFNPDFVGPNRRFQVVHDEIRYPDTIVASGITGTNALTWSYSKKLNKRLTFNQNAATSPYNNPINGVYRTFMVVRKNGAHWVARHQLSQRWVA